MKITKVAMLILAIAVALYILFPNLSWAEDAACSCPVFDRPFTVLSSATGDVRYSAFKRKQQLRRGAKNP